MEKIGVVEVRRQEGLPAPRARSGGARARARDCRNEPPCEPRTALEQTTKRTETMIIARQYHAEDRLRDGRCVWLRAIQLSDRDLLREGLHHLSPESAYHRFFSAKRELSEGDLDYFTQINFVNHVALVALVDDGSGPLLVGTARYIVEPAEVRPKSAEVAFVVGDAHQRTGSVASSCATWWRSRVAMGCVRFMHLSSARIDR